jgi:hypothetical protein
MKACFLLVVLLAFADYSPVLPAPYSPGFMSSALPLAAHFPPETGSKPTYRGHAEQDKLSVLQQSLNRYGTKLLLSWEEA